MNSNLWIQIEVEELIKFERMCLYTLINEALIQADTQVKKGQRGQYGQVNKQHCTVALMTAIEGNKQANEYAYNTLCVNMTPKQIRDQTITNTPHTL